MSPIMSDRIMRSFKLRRAGLDFARMRPFYVNTVSVVFKTDETTEFHTVALSFFLFLSKNVADEITLRIEGAFYLK